MSNVGTIAFNNDQAVAQVLTLQLNDAVIDAMVDSYHVSSVTQRETLNVDLTDMASLKSLVCLLLDVVGLTGKSGLNVTLAATGAAGDAVDTLALSASGGLGDGWWLRDNADSWVSWRCQGSDPTVQDGLRRSGFGGGRWLLGRCRPGSERHRLGNGCWIAHRVRQQRYGQRVVRR